MQGRIRCVVAFAAMAGVALLPLPGVAPAAAEKDVLPVRGGASGGKAPQAGGAPPAAVAPAPAPPVADCPPDFRGAGVAQGGSLTCACTPQAVATSAAVWGVDVYTDDSAICRAALHAGAIGPQGGVVTVLPEAGRASYPGSARNGVTTSSYGSWGGSFRFAMAPGGGQAAAAPPKPGPPQAATVPGAKPPAR